MELLRTFLHAFRDLEGLMNWGGYPVLMAIVFAETGLLVGFFLPGDSLLVTAGLVVGAAKMNPFELPPFGNLVLLSLVLAVVGILGDAVGYWIGHRAGPRIFTRERSLLFRKDHLLATQAFYDKHGGKTILIARFMPIVRTFAPVVAGVGQMPYRRFALFNVAGGFVWVFSMTFLGYFLGKVFDAKQMERIVYLVIAVSVAPLFVAWAKNRFAKKAEQPMPELR